MCIFFIFKTSGFVIKVYFFYLYIFLNPDLLNALDMKIKFLLLFVMLISFCGIKAQKPISLTEDSLKVGNNVYPAISVTIPEAEYEKTLKNWIKLQESGTKSKVVDEGGKLSIFGALSKDISENPINILSELVSRDSLLKLTAAFELKKDVYIERSTSEAELSKAKIYLFDFAKDQYIDVVNEQLKTEENKLRDLQKELGSLEKNQSGMEKNIRSNIKAINSEKDDLVVLNNELTTLSAAIIEHNTLLSSLEQGFEKDEKEKYIKGLEKEKKKVLKSIKKAENKISKSEKTINDANRAIPRNDEDQNRIRRRINDQEAVVQQFTNKLNKVKAYK